MTHISELIARARANASNYPQCGTEQALVYSCEDVASENHPLRVLTRAETHDLVTEMCSTLDIDIPVLQFARTRVRCSASTEFSTRTVAFYGSTPGLATVLHEIAHLAGNTGDHDADFRTALVRLARRWGGVEHASLLHHLFAGTGLGVGPWDGH